jgi:CheY-like chemotaxis protein
MRQATRWPPRGPVRVLLVLDQPLVTELVQLTLKHGAYHTRTATTWPAALATLATWQPHLVLVDMDLERGSLVHEMLRPAPGRVYRRLL